MDVVPAPEHRHRRARFRRTCRVAQRQARRLDLIRHDEQRLRVALVETMASTTPGRRDVLALAVLGGLAPAAIASQLGLSVEAVSLHLLEGINEVVTRFTR